MLTDPEDPNYCINWLKKSIEEELIDYYEGSDFKNIQQIEGNVSRATLESTDLFFALKSFDNRKLTKKVINEVKLHKKVNPHPNILKFYGITEMETGYFSVLEYADNSTLQAYLSKRINELDWNDKCHLALQLASAVEYLHKYSIIHHDLHANNILVHQNNIKLVGFGLLRNTDEKSSNSPDMISYRDPKSFNNKKFELSEKSDVYSIGVLMWQISSGHQPFGGYIEAHDITNGKREDIVDGTPIKYSNLYQECWKCEPNERPDMQRVVLTLRSIISNFDKTKIPENSNTIDLENDSFESIFINININNLIEKHNEGFTFEQIKQHINQQILQSNQSPSNIIDSLSKNQAKLRYIFFLGLFYYYNIDIEENEENSIKSFELFSKAAADNFSIAQVYLAKCYNDGYGTKKNKYLSFNWYQRAVKNKSIIGQFYLGYCYEHGIGTKQNEKEFIYWYEKAANGGNMTAKLHLANCYRLGKGVEKDETKAFKYYKVLALKISDAQVQLGDCFYNGIGTQEDKAQARYWYENAANNGDIVAKEKLKKHYNRRDIKASNFKRLKQRGLKYYEKKFKKTSNKDICYLQKAAESGDKIAQYDLGDFYIKGENKDERKAFRLYKQGYTSVEYQLGYCYDKGIGTDIDKIKAFELYKIAAKSGNSDAQNYLGLLYEDGQGVEKDSKEAFNLYEKAGKNNNAAQYNLGRCYQFGIGVEKDEIKAFDFYKSSAENNYLDALFDLGRCYLNGIGTEANKENALKSYEEAAKKGHTEAQMLLGLLYKNGQEIEKDLEKAFYWYNKAAKEDKEDNGAAQYNLGECYHLGIGTVINIEKAFEFYSKAAEKGDIEAKASLGLLYKNEKNLELVFGWYQTLKNKINGGAQDKSVRFKIIKQEQLNGIKQLDDNVSSAMMPTNSKVAIKKLRINIDKNRLLLLQKISELYKLHSKYNHPKIVEYLGISIKDESQLFLIMPFAEDGNLRNYIKTNNLSFDKKMKIVKDITVGIMFLHENDIIHEYLNPKNILIFNGVAKISNLPMLYELYDNNKDYNDNIFEDIGYIYPNLFLNKNNQDYKKNKSIDIYSLGSLLWEIMSEKIPYSEGENTQNMHILELITKIKGGYREDDIPHISPEYRNLYKKCWDGNISIKDVSDKLLEIKC